MLPCQVRPVTRLRIDDIILTAIFAGQIHIDADCNIYKIPFRNLDVAGAGTLVLASAFIKILIARTALYCV